MISAGYRFLVSSALLFGILSSSTANARSLKDRLMHLPGESQPAWASVGENARFLVHNIVHNKKLWTTSVSSAEISTIVAYTNPLPLGQFHMSLGIDFENTIKLENDNGETFEIKGLVLGTGPVIASGISPLLGKQNISTTVETKESFLGNNPKSVTHAHVVDPRKVSYEKLFLLNLEEATRLNFVHLMRISLLGTGTLLGRDPVNLNRYTFFNANCVTTGIRNLSNAAIDEIQTWILNDRVLKKDITGFEHVPSNANLIKRIQYFSFESKKLNRFLLDSAHSGPIDFSLSQHRDIQAAFNEAKRIDRNARLSNNVAIPSRSQRFLIQIFSP